MKKDWKEGLSKASVDFMGEILSQVPEEAQFTFTSILERIAEPSVEMCQRLDKLQALENCGVDNWDGYDDAMAELDGDTDEEEDEDDN